MEINSITFPVSEVHYLNLAILPSHWVYYADLFLFTCKFQRFNSDCFWYHEIPQLPEIFSVCIFKILICQRRIIYILLLWGLTANLDLSRLNNSGFCSTDFAHWIWNMSGWWIRTGKMNPALRNTLFIFLFSRTAFRHLTNNSGDLKTISVIL